LVSKVALQAFACFRGAFGHPFFVSERHTAEQDADFLRHSAAKNNKGEKMVGGAGIEPATLAL
jgi:hypothetical protein